ncbi:16S rRNA (guanine(966)-N(2))-methyltransferase RsmD [Lutispora thermophila]|uniref:16S rRNA (Guanine(966)-N(2))-methyltransferase RsmD n=1 Tax=Lutispora thermophila DSM 19022 TaxID=1122184 RepID=A0A1M6G4C0_9FIRM|nr:16S rRNA (guanine(966)-N(2))-methyltransferase RsmD [Lutispora thermophila]SHJ04657.1 16S rRNA (guanine(966)-N(2))-methyltransferase RsmD [Lutispora thermophila DSM 19022]
MRIIAGDLKGRKLESINTDNIRPTSDKVREALFSILGNKVIDSRFLDLFAGSGGVGIEAYSRGARDVVFVDASIDSIKVLKKNLEKINIINETKVIHSDYSVAIERLSNQGREFDIIFIDPPYKMGIALEAAGKILERKLLAEDGIIIIEHDSKDIMPETTGVLVKFKEKKYGNNSLSLYCIKN